MRRLASWAVYLYLGLIVLGAIMLRVKHPALTETELLLRFWPFWLGAVLLGLVVAVVFSGRRPP